MPSSKDYFVVSIATHDYRAVTTSILTMLSTAIALNRSIHWNISVTSGFARGRTEALHNLKRWVPEEKEVWTFSLDSDILVLEDPKRLASLILEAERTNRSFAGAYNLAMLDPQGNVRNTAYKTAMDSYTVDELAKAKDFELKLHHSGLGLSYIKMPLDYQFVENEFGEDVNFFKDNPQIDLRYCSIKNQHIKQVPL